MAGLFAGAALALIDAVRNHEVLLTAVLVAPLIAAIGASTIEVAVVGVYSVGIALLLGQVNDIFLTSDHIVLVGVVAIASGAAIALTRIREKRETELEIARPQAMDAERLRLALGAGRMGTWRWDLTKGRVDLDEQLEALFGLAPGSFDGSMAMYRGLFHPEDRDRAIGTVNDGMARDVAWRFDHRVVWPDGSVHWLEGRGEPVHDATGAIIGAAGVAVDIGERRMLLEAEQSSRARLRTLLESSERLAALDHPERVLETICQLAATRIGAWATVVRVAPDGSLERSNVAHRDPVLAPLVRELMERLTDDGASVAKVLKTGEPIVFHGLTAQAATMLDAEPDLRTKLERVGF